MSGLYIYIYSYIHIIYIYIYIHSYTHIYIYIYVHASIDRCTHKIWVAHFRLVPRNQLSHVLKSGWMKVSKGGWVCINIAPPPKSRNITQVNWWLSLWFLPFTPPPPLEKGYLQNTLETGVYVWGGTQQEEAQGPNGLSSAANPESKSPKLWHFRVFWLGLVWSPNPTSQWALPPCPVLPDLHLGRASYVDLLNISPIGLYFHWVCTLGWRLFGP